MVLHGKRAQPGTERNNDNVYDRRRQHHHRRSATAEQIPDGQEKFATEKELASVAANWPADRLVEIWNYFAGVAGFGADLKPVRKFTNRKAGVRRIWRRIQKLDAPARRLPPKPPTGTRKAAQVAPGKAKGTKGARVKEGAATAREGSKKAIILGMLGKGATISELMAAAGWQAHYADVQIMPTCVGNPAFGAGIAAMESA